MHTKHSPEGRFSSQRGVTLIELMITVVVAAVLVILALPSFERFTRNSMMATTANDFAAALSRARAEAVKTRRNVRMCPSEDGSTCSTSVSWGDGWIMFADADGNGVPATGELLQARQALDSRISLTVPAAYSQWLQFRPTGAVIGNGGVAGAFNVCSTNYDDLSRQVAIAASGRVTTHHEPDLCASG